MKQASTAQTLAAAGLAGALSNAVLYPLEVVRCRMSTDTEGVYRSIRGTFALITSREGPAALYRGLLPSVAAILPEAAITYGLFDLLSRGYTGMTGRDEAGVPASLTFGVISSFSGQIVAYPLETVSRRMQVRSARVPVAVLSYCSRLSCDQTQAVWLRTGLGLKNSNQCFQALAQPPILKFTTTSCCAACGACLAAATLFARTLQRMQPCDAYTRHLRICVWNYKASTALTQRLAHHHRPNGNYETQYCK